MSNLKHALVYLEKNKSIIPVGLDKRPFFQWEEFQHRRATVEEVTKWWEDYPTANIGIITGRISGITVVDVDVKSGGMETLTNIDLPMTLLAKTGGGGWHYYYKYNEAIKTGTNALQGIDIRNDGAYVVAPPSYHQSGNYYEWARNLEMVDAPVGLFPNKEKPDWSAVLKGVSAGSRNATATQVLGKLFRTFRKEDWETTVWQIITMWNASNAPPIPERELRATYQSIARLAERDNYKEIEKLEQKEEDKKEITFLTLDEVVELGDEELRNTNPDNIISWGYSWLDDRLVGIFPSELIVVGGESGSGKTAFATNVIYRASKKVKCGVYALEDRLPDYGLRSLFYEVNKLKKSDDGVIYPWNEFRRNEIQDPKFNDLKELAKINLKNQNIFFAKVENVMNIELLESLIKDQVKKGIKLFLVDHLHYFDLSSGDGSKADYIEKVMVRIKTLLNSTGASMILIVHYKKLEGKKPGLDSFKDSVSIPQNANYVINIWRDRSVENLDAVEKLGDRDVLKKYITHFFIPKVRNPNGEGTFKAEWNPINGDYIDERRDWRSGTPTNILEIAKQFNGTIL